jgi:hypothetical protein
MIKVWTHAAEAGLLDRHGERGSTFAYLPGPPPTREVSVTMPLRLESWSVPFGLLPASRCTKALQGLRIDTRRLMSKLLHVLNVRPRINSGMAVRAALTAQFQHT